MSGVWGAGGPRCQAALAVLASLCRARPPPLGLDVETCRSFELQSPEQSPSAADSGTGRPRSLSTPGFLFSVASPAQGTSPRAPEPQKSSSESQSGSVPWLTARRERFEEDLRGENPSPARSLIMRARRCGILGASVSLVSWAHPRSDWPG